MKSAISEFIEYSDQEKLELLNNATIVFDTNVLLNLYRYSNKTRMQLFDSFNTFNDRLWLPYNVALEFCERRYETIYEVNNIFDKIEKEKSKIIDILINNLRIEKSDDDLNRLL